MLTESVNKSFLAGFMIVTTACRVDESKFVGFFFWMGFLAIWREVMNFSWGRKGIFRT